MAHYLLDLINEAETKLAELKDISPVERAHYVIKLDEEKGRLTRFYEKGPAVGDELFVDSRDAFESAVRGIYDVVVGLKYPGAVMTAMEFMDTVFPVLISHRQEAEPHLIAKKVEAEKRIADMEAEIKDSVASIKPVVVNAAREEAEDKRLQELRQGTPPVEVEKVLVVDRERVEIALNMPDGLQTGFFPPQGLNDLARLRPFVHFMDRPVAEKSPAYKQLIVYAVIVYHMPGKGPCILCYQRGKKGGESRLHSKWSIGVGGHINPKDWEWRDGNDFNTALLRELREEAGILPGHINNVTFEGFVNNEENEVGMVHLGAVYIVELDNIAGFNFEDTFVTPFWMPLATLVTDHTASGQEFEAWSAIIAKPIYNTLRKAGHLSPDSGEPGPGYVNQNPLAQGIEKYPQAFGAPFRAPVSDTDFNDRKPGYGAGDGNGSI